jgi:hypothetical protein
METKTAVSDSTPPNPFVISEKTQTIEIEEIETNSVHSSTGSGKSNSAKFSKYRQ